MKENKKTLTQRKKHEKHSQYPDLLFKCHRLYRGYVHSLTTDPDIDRTDPILSKQMTQSDIVLSSARSEQQKSSEISRIIGRKYCFLHISQLHSIAHFFAPGVMG